MGEPRNIVVGITGASGVAIGVRVLQVLATSPDVNTHLVMSSAGALTLAEETDFSVRDVQDMADVVHKIGAIGDSIASGSFPVQGMIIAPCSIKTLSAVANCYSDNLITRAADVTLKQGRPLVMVVRESPLHIGHLRLMTAASEAGAVIMPPVPAFYPHPESVDQIIDHIARRALSRIGLESLDVAPWTGMSKNRAPSAGEV